MDLFIVLAFACILIMVLDTFFTLYTETRKGNLTFPADQHIYITLLVTTVCGINGYICAILYHING